jgi:two-component system chemotaxis response regulator CheY
MADPMRILIIDDNAAIRMILTDMLETMGHKVIGEAADRDAALKIYAEHKPDIVTLDLSLSAVGGADGLAVLKALRTVDDKAKIIVISGNAQEKVRVMVEQAGACCFVGKPIKEEDLTTALAKAAQS